MTDQLIQLFLSALVSAGVAWFVARRQRRWGEEAVRRQARDQRLEAAQAVLTGFADHVQAIQRSEISRPIRQPFDEIGTADWLALANVSDLFRDVVSDTRMRPALFYPANYLAANGDLADGQIAGDQWDPVRVRAIEAIQRITLERARLGGWADDVTKAKGRGTTL